MKSKSATPFVRKVGAASATFLIAAALLATPTSAQAPPKFYDLDKAPKPSITGAEIIAGLEEFVQKFPLRQNLLPNNAAAAQFLAKEAEKHGFNSRILEYEVTAPEPRMVRVVESIKRGTKYPDEWIAFVAHYDIVAPDGAGVTIEGAYDDGSGTNLIRFFGKAFSKIKTNRSIALLWFDGEENGLLASEVYAQELKDKGQKIKAVLGFDMAGIGYPSRYCICIFHGSNFPQDPALAVPLINYVNFDFLEFPEGDGAVAQTERWPFGTDGHVCNCGVNTRNSDEQNFRQQGYFTMRWAGMRTAAEYPAYHKPWDTVDFMEFVAGSRELLEKGAENTFLSAYYTALVLDNLR